MKKISFSTQVKLCLWEQKRTQWWLAREANVEPSVLSRHLNGWIPMPPEVQERIAEVLGIEPEVTADADR